MAGGEGVFEFVGEEGDFGGGVGFCFEEVVSDEHFGEDGGGFGEGEDGVKVDEGLFAREHVMDGVSEFVGHCGDVSGFAEEVEHDVGFHVGGGAGAEGGCTQGLCGKAASEAPCGGTQPCLETGVCETSPLDFNSDSMSPV